MKSIQRETRQPHMRKILEAVFTRIIRNGVDRLFRRKHVGHNCVRQAGEIAAYRILPHAGVNECGECQSEEQVAAPPEGAKNWVSRCWQRLPHQLRFCGYVGWEASLAYSVSISRTGSSHPNRDVTLAHPASSFARVWPVPSICARASERAAESCRVTRPASFASSGAIPHCSVTITGVPAATASAAVFPKFSFCDGSTKTSASRYAAHLFPSKMGPTN